MKLNSLSVNHTKWSNTPKQSVGCKPTNCLSVFDHFAGLALKGLTHYKELSDFDLISILQKILFMDYLSQIKPYKKLYFPFLFFFVCLPVILVLKNASRVTLILSTASSFFGTQSQLTQLLVKNLTLLLREKPVFQGVAPWHTNFTLSSIITLWDSVAAHSPFGKELNTNSQENASFVKLYFILRHPSGTQQRPTYPAVLSSSLPLQEMPFFSGLIVA